MRTLEKFAVIIGIGFPALSGEGEGLQVQTRFGKPSAPIHTVTLERHSLLSLRRHGDDHSIPPHAINYRANLAALKEAGANSLIASNTAGVLSNVREPGQVAVPDQIVDYTWGREHTIFDGSDGVVEHNDDTEPFSGQLRNGLLMAARYFATLRAKVDEVA